MRVIRPARSDASRRRRRVGLALGTLAVGAVAASIALVSPTAPFAGTTAASAAVGLGVGTAWFGRALRPPGASRLAERMATVLSTVFDDAYTLVLGPQLPIRDAARLHGLLVGPAGVRALTARDWVGRYRVRRGTWEFDARGRRGWIRCRTNPGRDAAALAAGVERWARERGIGEMHVRGAVVFPGRTARLVLEEPDGEIVTSDNAPWWANAIGRVRRLSPADAGRLLTAVLDAADAPAASAAKRREPARPG